MVKPHGLFLVDINGRMARGLHSGGGIRLTQQLRARVAQQIFRHFLTIKTLHTTCSVNFHHCVPHYC